MMLHQQHKEDISVRATLIRMTGCTFNLHKKSRTTVLKVKIRNIAGYQSSLFENSCLWLHMDGSVILHLFISKHFFPKATYKEELKKAMRHRAKMIHIFCSEWIFGIFRCMLRLLMTSWCASIIVLMKESWGGDKKKWWEPSKSLLRRD